MDHHRFFAKAQVRTSRGAPTGAQLHCLSPL